MVCLYACMYVCTYVRMELNRLVKFDEISIFAIKLFLELTASMFPTFKVYLFLLSSLRLDQIYIYTISMNCSGSILHGAHLFKHFSNSLMYKKSWNKWMLCLYFKKARTA